MLDVSISSQCSQNPFVTQGGNGNLRIKSMFEVVYKVIKNGVVIRKRYDSPFLCRKLVNKLKHSKTCQLISYPILD